MACGLHANEGPHAVHPRSIRAQRGSSSGGGGGARGQLAAPRHGAPREAEAGRALSVALPLTSSVAVFSDPAKDYIVRVGGDPREPATQRHAAAKAADILLEWKARGTLPCVDTPTLRSETWAAVARRWLDVVAREEYLDGPHFRLEDCYAYQAAFPHGAAAEVGGG